MTITNAINNNSNTFSTTLLTNSEFQSYSETVVNVTAGTTTQLNMNSGKLFVLSQGVNITTFQFINPPATGKVCSFTLKRVKDNSATPRSITWPSGTKWPGGTVPTLTSTANCVDIFTFFTDDGGTTWYGFTVGLAMA